MAVYTISEFIMSKSDIKSKISALEALLEALETAELDAVSDSKVQEYQLNDGQTIIRTLFRNPSEIETTISKIEARINKYRNMAIGRRNRLIDKDTIH